jgi:nucleotide-binding universal stress UspA family protein
MYRTILVPLDGSALAEAALTHALAMGQAGRSTIALLRVPVLHIASQPPTLGETLPDAMAHYDDELYQRVKDYLDHLATRLPESGLAVTTDLRYGDVPTAILDYADEIGADLIVMSTHGRGGIARWLLGSVASKIVQSAHCPVLLIRPGEQPAAHATHRQ